jgi:hypothetical protein
MKGKPGGWENALLIAYLLPTGSVAAYSVPLVGARSSGAAKCTGRNGSTESKPRQPQDFHRTSELVWSPVESGLVG